MGLANNSLKKMGSYKESGHHHSRTRRWKLNNWYFQRNVAKECYCWSLSWSSGKRQSSAMNITSVLLAISLKRSCRVLPSVCNLSRHHAQRAPLIPLPVLSEQFKRIAMDIIGPLLHSRSGKSMC